MYIGKIPVDLTMTIDIYFHIVNVYLSIYMPDLTFLLNYWSISS